MGKHTIDQKKWRLLFKGLFFAGTLFIPVILSFLQAKGFFKNKHKKSYAKVIALFFILLLWIPIYQLYSFQTSKTFGFGTDCKDCNVVLIVVDTLRKDHLPLYGYQRNTAPNITAFSQKSVVFNHNYAASNWTLPAMMSLMTGVYPNHHGVNNKFTFGHTEMRTTLDNNAPHLITIAEYFEKNGYQTAGFTGGAGVASEAGFIKGFNQYEDQVDFAGFDRTVPLSLEWLKKVEKKPINKHFLFLHGYDVHGQYVNSDTVGNYYSQNYTGNLDGSPAEHVDIRDQSQINQQLFLNEEDQNYLVDRYDDKIFEMDSRLSDFLDEYKKIDFDKPTIFIITSDHGEEWFDHGGIDHGTTLYQEVVNTPLIIHFPNQNNKIEIDTIVSAVDLLPTLLDIVGIEKSNTIEIDGSSFKQVIDGQKIKEEAFFHSEYREIASLRGGINADKNKLIVNLATTTSELFNIDKDKDEQDSINNETLYKNMQEWLSHIFPKVTLLPTSK